MDILEIINQLGISVFGILAVILVARKNKWGFIFGLLSQPFWLLTSLNNRQWGVVVLTIVYTGSWGYGVWQWFSKK